MFVKIENFSIHTIGLTTVYVIPRQGISDFNMSTTTTTLLLFPLIAGASRAVCGEGAGHGSVV